MRIIKFLGIIGGSLLVLTVLAVVVINAIPGERYRDLISAAVRSATGRDLVIGDLQIQLGSSVKLVASDVSLSNADWGSRPQMFTGRLVEAEVALLPLLSGVLDLRLVLEAPDLLLERNAEGRGNWHMGIGAPEQSSNETTRTNNGTSLRPLIRELRLEAVKLAYIDARSGERHRAALENVTVSSLPDNVKVELNGRLDDQVLKLTGGIEDAPTADAATPADFNLTGELGAATLRAHGMLEAISTTARTDLSVEVRLASLAALSAIAGRALPEQGPVQANLRLRGRDGHYSAEDIRLSLGKGMLSATVEGAVADLNDLSGLQADLSLETKSLSRLSSFTATKLPDSGSLKLTGRLVSPQGLKAPSTISATLDADGVAAKIHGQIANLLAGEGSSLAVEVEGASLQQVARLAGADLKIKAPLSLATNLSLADHGYAAEQLRVALGDSEMTGDLKYVGPAQQGKRAKLLGNLHLGKLDLQALAEPGSEKPAQASSASEANAKARVQTAGRTPGKVFSRNPLPLATLRSLDVDMDMDITADTIGTQGLLLRQVAARLTLNKGVLKLKPVDAVVGRGRFEADATLDATVSPAALAVGIAMQNGTSRHFGGRYNLKVDLDGRGDSIAQVMAGLDGQVILDLRDLKLERSFMTQFGRGLIDTINPFEKQAKKTRLVCAIVRFDIQDGIADAEDKIVAQLTKVTWFGGGEVNLKTETLDLGAQSKPRTGLGIDTLVGLPNLVHIGGTLANPKVVPDPKGVVKTYGEGYLTVVTGGLYLLAKGLWNRTQANSDVCAQILAMKREVRVKRNNRKADSGSRRSGTHKKSKKSVIDSLDVGG